MTNQMPQKKATFTEGSTMRHVIVMTATSSVGLVSIFVVDLINLFYISLLGQQELAAAIGYSATIMFFSVSVCIGLSIATAAQVGRALGANQDERARRLATSSLIYLVGVTTVFAAILYPLLPSVLSLFGAKGETLELSLQFMRIVTPSIPFLGGGMVLGALLRAKGDPKRAMYITLSGGAIALILDPILIIWMDLGLVGAALVTVIVRFGLIVVGLWGVVKVHNMLGPINWSVIKENTRPYFAIAVPAIATQLATPVGNAYVTSAMAQFGDDAVAGWAIIGRVIPVSFGVIFALSGAVGPILSQNLGARLYDRVNATMRDALTFTLAYCLVVWGLLALAHPWIITLFDASDAAATLVATFCLLVAASFLFNGFLFVANAAFNNLGYPVYATVFNWGRATLGVMPFVAVGQAYGAEGVLIGWGLGAVVFGLGAAAVAFQQIKKLPQREQKLEARTIIPPSANSPFTSGRGASFSIETSKLDPPPKE